MVAPSWQTSYMKLPTAKDVFKNLSTTSCCRNIPCKNRTSGVFAQLGGSPTLDMLSWDDFNLASGLWWFHCDGPKLDTDCLPYQNWSFASGSCKTIVTMYKHARCTIDFSCLFWYWRFLPVLLHLCCQYTCDVQWPWHSLKSDLRNQQKTFWRSNFLRISDWGLRP